MSSALPVFEKTTHVTNIWLNDLMENMGWDDRHRAYQASRSVLHALRDRLRVEEVAHLGAQLPMLMRGFFYEGWRPTETPTNERKKDQFLEHVKSEYAGPDDVDIEKMTRGVFQVLENRVAGGEIEDVKHMLPSEIRELWPSA